MKIASLVILAVHIFWLGALAATEWLADPLPAVKLKEPKQPPPPKILEKVLVVPTLPFPVKRLRDFSEVPIEPYSVVEILKRLQRAAKDVRLLEVWSLDPSAERFEVNAQRIEASVSFRDFSVLGHEELKEMEEVQKLILSVVLSISVGPDESFECFEPRHGLRIHDPKGFIDLALCYSCLNGVLYDGKEEYWFSTAKDAETDFDVIFTKLKLKKAK